MTQHGSIVYLEGVSVTFDGFQALRGVNLYVEHGELRALIGPNGAGKTTLLDVICGQVKPDTGRVLPTALPSASSWLSSAGFTCINTRCGAPLKRTGIAKLNQGCELSKTRCRAERNSNRSSGRTRSTTRRNTSSFRANVSSILVASLPWTLPERSCRETSTTCVTCSPSVGLTPAFGSC